MGTLFPSTFFFCCCFFFFFSPDYILSDKMFYQDGLKNYFQLSLPQVVGPESIAFDCYGKGPYVSVSDGRILKWQGANQDWTEFAVSAPHRDRQVCDGSTNPKMEPLCGRPLGLKFNHATCDLYIADAYYGLLVVGPGGGVATQLASSAEGIPFNFMNALDIDTKTGVVYFTDSSRYFQRRDYILAIISGDRTGRFLKYDPNSKTVTVLLRGLAFPNGVAISKDNTFVLVAESSTMRILKFPILGSGIGNPLVFIEFGRFPDNIKSTSDGEFWVALNTGRGKIQDLNSTSTILQQKNVVRWLVDDPVAVKLDAGGKAIRVLDGNGGVTLDSVSEVEEYNGNFWIGSSMKPYVGYIIN